MKIIDIAQITRQTGLKPSTLRYYEEIGLITSVGRHGLRRQFGPETLLQLSLITLGKSAGFSLDEIAGMFGRDGQPDLPRADLHARADALDQQIKDLTVMSKALRHVADCPAPSHMECPKFQKLVRITNRRKPSNPGKPFVAKRYK